MVKNLPKNAQFSDSGNECTRARIYDVPTFRFNEAVKQNKHRFPSDFRIQLTEKNGLRFGLLKIAKCDLKRGPQFEFIANCEHPDGMSGSPVLFVEEHP